jgi:murein DD-endopeptidase MepM/ murein hydrolase activator NlpD
MARGPIRESTTGVMPSKALITFLAGLFACLALAGGAAAAGNASVAALQVALHAHGTYGGTVDGIRGPQTTRAIRRFQRRAGLVVDGVVGRQTRRALGRLGRPRLGSRVLVRGRRGWDVSALQFLLAWHGFPSGNFDGDLGARTDAALRRFQRWAGLSADGAAGPATIAALRRAPARAPISFARPVRAAVTDRFGPRGNRFHTGIDFPASHGARVFAARGGRVKFARWDSGGFGYLVRVGHGNGVRTWYAHLSSIRVRRGQHVHQGTVVGRVGSSGFSTGPHLHFEVRIRGAAVDPLPALR